MVSGSRNSAPTTLMAMAASQGLPGLKPHRAGGSRSHPAFTVSQVLCWARPVLTFLASWEPRELRSRRQQRD